MTRALAVAVLVSIPALAFAQSVPASSSLPPSSAGAPASAASAPASTSPQVKIGGTIFADFTETISPKSADAASQPYRPSSFNLTRAYVNVAGSLNSVFSARITTDVARETGSGSSLAGSYTLRAKYVYGQISLDKWTGRFTQTWIRVGLSPTPFVEGRDQVYRYRFQGSEMPERDGYISSADTGISVHTNLPGGFGDVQASLINGEGYNKAEVNDQKALQMRATIRPGANGKSAALRGIRVSGFTSIDHYVRNADRTRTIGTLWFEHARVNAGVDVLRTTDQTLPTASAVNGKGWDFFVTPFFKEKGRGPEAIFRMDFLTTDTTKPDQRRRLIAGVSYWWTLPGNTGAALLFDYESVVVRNPSVPTPDQKKLILHGVVTF